MSRPSGESRKAVAPEPYGWNDSAAELRVCSFGIYLWVVRETGSALVRAPGPLRAGDAGARGGSTGAMLCVAQWLPK